VTLLTDPTLKVAALDLNTQASGVVSHGEGRSTLILDRVSKSQAVRARDWIITQGFRVGNLTSRYPRGIPIGTVSGASVNDVDLYWQVQLRPRVDFGSLQSVLVLVPKSRKR
jgi:rod shape-determining protein MreC